MSGHNADEEIDPQLDKAIETASEHIQEVHNILKRETARVREEKQAFDAVAEKLKHVHFPKTVKLNVGGQCFITSLDTMKKDPGSMLHAMFSERFEVKPAEDGSYFIDRDGTHFRYILNYLRTGQLVLPDSEVVRRELLIEAEFYQIQGIIDELRARPFKDSLILSEEQRQTLITWLSDTLQSGSCNYGLLYRASRDGWTSTNFHSRCDSKGPTVTVAKHGNYIFGGYTEIPWEAPTSGIYRKASRSFLFSLVNPTGLAATKMTLLPGEEDAAVYCHSGYGPTFGRGNDLCIPSSPNSSNCYTNLNNSYQLPVGQNAATFFTGKQSFIISEMEVFGFEK